jgi:hypothetical protein
VFNDIEFNVLPLDVRIEYMLPAPLPFSFGLFMKTPYSAEGEARIRPNFKSFGARAAYHFNILGPATDFYLVYSFDFGFLRKNILEEYDDDYVPVRWYDFRFGARHFFNSRLGLALETGFKFQELILLVSFKIY